MSGPIYDLVVPYLRGKIKSSGPDDIGAPCPFHEDSNPSFAINIKNGLWICHGCGLSGGLATFLKYAGLSRDRIDSILEPLRADLERHNERLRRKENYRFRTSDPFLSDIILPETILGTFDFKPLDLVENGFSPKVLRRMEVGYDKSKDRITFPIRDAYGNLVGISGRAAGDSNLRYKVYQGSDKGLVGDFGKYFDEQFPKYRIKNRLFLWNAHTIYPKALHSVDLNLIIVEGYKACIWLVQNGWPDTVALMGRSITGAQHDLIHRMTDTVTLFLDNDKPGREATKKVGSWLSRTLRVYVCQPDHKVFKQPDYLSRYGIRKVMENRMRYEKWLRSQRT
jgi:DNA primase